MPFFTQLQNTRMHSVNHRRKELKEISVTLVNLFCYLLHIIQVLLEGVRDACRQKKQHCVVHDPDLRRLNDCIIF